jgi:hypothetical protein
MRNYAVRPLRHAARRDGTTSLPPVLRGLALRVWGLALFHQHSAVPAGRTSNLSADMARVARPGSWEDNGPPSGGLRWSTRITATMTGDHTASPDAGALRQDSHVVSRRGVLRRRRLAPDRFHHSCTIRMIRAHKACLPRVRSAATLRTRRSHAWLRRNVRQHWDVARWPGPQCRGVGRYFRTVRGETRRPSLSRNSFAMRRWPHVRLSHAICRMSACSSAGMAGRPALECLHHNTPNP